MSKLEEWENGYQDVYLATEVIEEFKVKTIKAVQREAELMKMLSKHHHSDYIEARLRAVQGEGV